MNAPQRNDVLADITRYLSCEAGGDRAYLVQQSRLGMGLVIAATDIDSLERSDWELVLRPRTTPPVPPPNPLLAATADDGEPA